MNIDLDVKEGLSLLVTLNSVRKINSGKVFVSRRDIRTHLVHSIVWKSGLGSCSADGTHQSTGVGSPLVGGVCQPSASDSPSVGTPRPTSDSCHIEFLSMMASCSKGLNYRALSVSQNRRATTFQHESRVISLTAAPRHFNMNQGAFRHTVSPCFVHFSSNRKELGRF